ncbi:hypothetical protein [Aeromonas salmonicida]|uniref:hypothetical protein n=1 Tax=Aeromonas salmonicida TaxID=645 RepID=UPI0021169629|nr:hypothetical protein [Aeromonas salmonicida]UUI59115.1 hypothetical protein NP805_12990 [Aeromonas salmonicida]
MRYYYYNMKVNEAIRQFFEDGKKIKDIAFSCKADECTVRMWIREEKKRRQEQNKE